MKKIRRLLIFMPFSIIIFSTLKCERIDCLQESRPLDESEKSFIPYNINDSIFYTNSIDTFKINCIAKDYKQESDFYYDNYYEAHCNGGQERRYWKLSSKYNTNILYTDSSKLVIELNIRTSPYLDKESIFELKLYDGDHVLYREEYSFFLNPKTPNRLLKEYSNGSFNYHSIYQCNLSFQDEILIADHLYYNVNILSGELSGYDSVYYNNEYGIVRLVRADETLNIIK